MAASLAICGYGAGIPNAARRRVRFASRSKGLDPTPHREWLMFDQRVAFFSVEEALKDCKSRRRLQFARSLKPAGIPYVLRGPGYQILHRIA